MSELTADGQRVAGRRSFAEWLEHRAMTAPPRRARGPVFLGDCVTAWGGRPMLLLLDERDAGE